MAFISTRVYREKIADSTPETIYKRGIEQLNLSIYPLGLHKYRAQVDAGVYGI